MAVANENTTADKRRLEAVVHKEQHHERPPLQIVVTGDVFQEQYFWPRGGSAYEEQELAYTSPDELRSVEPTAVFQELSGAPLHSQIFHRFLEGCKFKQSVDFDVVCVPAITELEKDARRNLGGPFPIYLHELAPFPAEESPQGHKTLVWRISRSFGEIRRPKPLDTSQLPGEILEPLSKYKDSIIDWLPGFLNQDTPRVLVVNDRNATKENLATTSIRSLFSACRIALPASFDANKSKLLILWHTRSPLLERDSIYQFFVDHDLIDRVIPIIHYNCLRDAGVPIRFDVSYETTFKTFLDAAAHPTIKALARFQHTLIRFDYGVLHVSAKNGAINGLDVHAVNAGPYASTPSRNGMMPGRTPLLVACVLREILNYYVSCRDIPPDNALDRFLAESAKFRHPTVLHNTPLDRAIDYGLILANLHARRGFGKYNPSGCPQNFESECTATAYGTLAAALVECSPTLERSTDCNGDYRLEIESGVDGSYDIEPLSRLSTSEDVLGLEEDAQANRSLISRISILFHPAILERLQCSRQLPDGCRSHQAGFLLREIVKLGLDRVLSIENEVRGKIREPSIICPYVSVGDIISVDAQEIDSLLALRYLVEKYSSSPKWNEPLSICVFGKPGTGKSRLVKQALRAIAGCTFNGDLECNISQVTSQEELARHFHRVQDRTRDGEIPVVFFDEFDSSLRGATLGWLKFFLMPMQDGLYRDGTDSYKIGKSVFVFAGGTCNSFAEFHKKHGSNSDAKVPDFVSRLRGFLDIQDLAYDKSKSAKNATTTFLPTTSNRATQVRRAIVLRNLLLKCMPHIFDRGSNVARVDDSVIDAFLYVTTFAHGIRSMESILQMSRVSARNNSFQPSALPPIDQLSMHVNAQQFLKIAQGGK